MTRDQWIFAGIMFAFMACASAATNDALPPKVVMWAGVLAAGFNGLLTVVKGSQK